jgi:hypothetical protein
MAQFEVLSLHLHTVNEENHEKSQGQPVPWLKLELNVS